MNKTRDSFKPFIIIIICFVLCTILLNLASQFYFTSQRVTKLIEGAVPVKDKLNLNFKKAQLGFSGSLDPFFAVKITNLDLELLRCGESYGVKAPYLLIPFSIKKALNKKVSLGYIKAGQLDVRVFDNSDNCTSEQKKAVSIREKINDIKTEKNYQKVFKRLQDVFRNLKGFRILKFKYIKDSDSKKIIVKNIRIAYNKREKSIYTYNELEFLPDYLNNEGANSKLDVKKNNIELKIKSTISEKNGFSFQANARHLEGVVEIKSKPQKSINNYFVDGTVKDMPLTFLGYITGFTKLEYINAHRVWYNSNVKINFKNFFDTDQSIIDMKFHNLEIFGPVMKASGTDFTLQVYPNLKVIDKINWRLETLNLNGLIASKKLSQLRGVVDQFGVLNGMGYIDQDSNVNFEGLIKNSSFKFSMNGKKANQNIEKANILFEYKKPEIYFLLENITLEKGVFDGEIKSKIVLNEGYNWNFNVTSENLSLSSEVLNLYEIEQTPFRNLKLKTSGSNKVLNNLDLSSQVDKLTTKWGVFLNSDYKLNYEVVDHIYKFDLNSETFKLNANLLKIEHLGVKQQLNSFKTTLKLASENKSFSLFSKTTSAPFLELNASGEDFNKTFTSELSVGNSQFTIEGQINSGFKIKSVN